MLTSGSDAALGSIPKNFMDSLVDNSSSIFFVNSMVVGSVLPLSEAAASSHKVVNSSWSWSVDQTLEEDDDEDLDEVNEEEESDDNEDDEEIEDEVEEVRSATATKKTKTSAIFREIKMRRIPLVEKKKWITYQKISFISQSLNKKMIDYCFLIRKYQ